MTRPSGTGFAYDVFLSHTSSDKREVVRVAEHLEGGGLRVWLDSRNIGYGENILLAIQRGLDQSRTVLLFLSPMAVASGWVGLESSAAIFPDPTNSARRVIPVLLADCEIPSILRPFRHFDLRQRSRAALDQLLAACRPEAAGGPSVPRSPPLPSAGVRAGWGKPLEEVGQVVEVNLTVDDGPGLARAFAELSEQLSHRGVTIAEWRAHDNGRCSLKVVSAGADLLPTVRTVLAAMNGIRLVDAVVVDLPKSDP